VIGMEKSMKTEERSEWNGLLDLSKSAELIWSLAELLFIKPPGRFLILFFSVLEPMDDGPGRSRIL